MGGFVDGVDGGLEAGDGLAGLRENDGGEILRQFFGHPGYVIVLGRGHYDCGLTVERAD